VPVIVTIVPTGPVVAEKEIIVGARIKVNPANDAEPPGVVRLTAPVAPVPTLATIEVEETTVNEVTGVPPNVTIEVPVKFVPLMLMTAPAAALVGAKDVIVGEGIDDGGINIKPASVAVPPGVVRLTAPVAPVPTLATIDVEETTVNEITGVPPNVITEVPMKFVPVMLMIAPAAAVLGAKDVIVGEGIDDGGINIKPASDAEPPGVVRLTAPVAPDPTMATIDVEETTVNDVTGVPPKVIIEVPVKLVPAMLMIAPAAAVPGAKLVIVGAGGGKYENTQAAPKPELSQRPPTIAVLPSAFIETLPPCSAPPKTPVPTILLPCCVQTPPLRL
jgi:hypothetical protein